MSGSLLLAVMREMGQLARRNTLLKHGIADGEIRRAVASGLLARPVRGWYATRRADRDQLRAITAGARVGCVSALRRWGAWAGEGRRLHLHAEPTASRMSLAPLKEHVQPPLPHPSVLDTRAHEMRPILEADAGAPAVHWQRQRWHEGRLDWIVSPRDALAQAVRCQPFEQAVACIDSALALDVVSEDEWFRMLDMLPRRLVQLDAASDSRAGSGNETVARLRVREAGLRVEPQAFIPGVGSVDLLVEGLVVIEVDSEAFHADAEQRRRDRRRTVLAQAYGIPTIRVGPEQLAVEEWPLVLAALYQQLHDTRCARAMHRPLASG